eukprot:12264711-Alexandrium_andersonii.AAC.1
MLMHATTATMHHAHASLLLFHTLALVRPPARKGNKWQPQPSLEHRCSEPCLSFPVLPQHCPEDISTR